MNGKIVGTVLGMIGMLLWFMPLVKYGSGIYSGSNASPETGSDIGGIAYVLLAASIAYAASSWLNQHVLRIILSVLALVACVAVLYSHRSYAIAWGLVALMVVHLVGLALAAIDNIRNKPNRLLKYLSCP